MDSSTDERLEAELRAHCPSGAVGYKLIHFGPAGVEVNPRIELLGRDYYALNADICEFPTAARAGQHQVQFVDSGGIAIPMRKQVLINLGTTEPPESVEDEQIAEFYPRSSDFQRDVQSVILKKKQIAVAREARYTSEIAEYHAHYSSMFDDTARRFARLDELSRVQFEAQLAMTQRLAAELAKVTPPPPPQDWAGLLKTGVEGVQTVITTAINARATSKADLALAERLERLCDKVERLSNQVTVLSGAQGTSAPPALAGQYSASADPAVPPAQPPPAPSPPAPSPPPTAPPPTPPPPPPPPAPPPTPPAPTPPPAPPARPVSPQQQVQQQPVGPATPQKPVLAAGPREAPDANAYKRAWTAMRRVVSMISDVDVIHMVANPALLVSFISLLAAMSPDSMHREQLPLALHAALS